MVYIGPCILRPLIDPDKCGLKLKVVLKWRHIYVENKKSAVPVGPS